LDAQGNVVRTASGRPIADTSKWILVNGEPLIDVTGDGSPDNYDCVGRGMKTCVSMLGNGTPSYDINSDGLFDVDLNGDGVPDEVNDRGAQLIDSQGATHPVDQGFANAAW